MLFLQGGWSTVFGEAGRAQDALKAPTIEVYREDNGRNCIARWGTRGLQHTMTVI
jgi:hypothetical protein